MIRTLTLITLILVAKPCQADSFLGLEMGASLGDAAQVVAGSPMKLQSHKVDGNKEIVTFAGNHRLKGASTTVLTFYKKQLLSVDITFDDSSGSVWTALSIQLEAKYGKLTTQSTGDDDVECCYILAGGFSVMMTRFWHMTIDLPHSTNLLATDDELHRQMILDRIEQDKRDAKRIGSF